MPKISPKLWLFKKTQWRVLITRSFSWVILQTSLLILIMNFWSVCKWIFHWNPQITYCVGKLTKYIDSSMETVFQHSSHRQSSNKQWLLLKIIKTLVQAILAFSSKVINYKLSVLNAAIAQKSQFTGCKVYLDKHTRILMGNKSGKSNQCQHKFLSLNLKFDLCSG